MIINDKEYGFTILPQTVYVVAEIYEVFKMNDGSDLHISKLSKDFGSIFRKPIEKDYIEARKWVEIQLKCISEANREVM